MEVFGQQLSHRELESYMSDMRQWADIRLLTLDDGLERGVRVAEARTGSGFDFTVLLDRAMDIGTATFHGIPLAWQSGAGAVNPARYEPEGLGWLRTFHGGLLSLCGLTNAGFTPDKMIDAENGNESLGLHGRINTLPAYDVAIERNINDDQLELRLHGTVDEVVLFGYKLRLQRTIEITAGVPELRITDRVRNFGGLPAPLMILYHCNFGYPIVSPDSVMTSPSGRILPRDAAAEPGLANWHQMIAPVPGFAEQVYWHELSETQGMTSASIFNHRLGVGVEVEFDATQLPYLTEWKQMGFGDYVLGIEPANCYPIGRVKTREAGALRMLPPGETEPFTITLRMLQSPLG
jgi:hypothetical protein